MKTFWPAFWGALLPETPGEKAIFTLLLVGITLGLIFNLWVP